MRRALRRSCATASTRGGACPSMAARGRSGEALAQAVRSRGRGCRSMRRTASPPPARRPLALPTPAIESSCLDRFHTVGPALDWLEARRIAAAGGASRIYCAAASSLTLRPLLNNGSSRQRTSGRRIDPGRARRAGRARIVVGPQTAPRRRRRRLQRAGTDPQCHRGSGDQQGAGGIANAEPPRRRAAAAQPAPLPARTSGRPGRRRVGSRRISGRRSPKQRSPVALQPQPHAARRAR